MSKKLILGLAFAVVLVSGAYYSADAACGFSCLPHISMPSCLSFSCAAHDADKAQARDADRADIKDGSYKLGVPNVQQGDQ